ncbi:MAG: hypothetical protein RSF90_00925, partial [Pygmaiobacter sp.]
MADFNNDFRSPQNADFVSAPWDLPPNPVPEYSYHPPEPPRKKRGNRKWIILVSLGLVLGFLSIGVLTVLAFGDSDP